MNKLFTTLFLFFSFLLHSQNYNDLNAVVTKEDLLSDSYPADSVAHALVIYEKGFTEIDDDEEYNLVTKYIIKIKILDKQGVEDEATVKIPLSIAYDNGDTQETLKDLEAANYKWVNGGIVKKSISKEQVYSKETENRIIKTFTLPDVEAGDVIVYSYKKISPFIHYFETWDFQSDLPKLYSEFTAKIPANYEYFTTLVGTLKLDTEETEVLERCLSMGISRNPADCIQTKYAMKNIPAFRTEAYMTSAYNFQSRLKYEMNTFTRPSDGYEVRFSKSWKDVNKEIRDHLGIGKQWDKADVEGVLPEAISSLPNDLEKARKIYHFVQDSYSWNGRMEIYNDITIKDLLSQGSGNIMTLNSLLLRLYREEGFKAYPVMSATRNFGFISRLHPVLNQFNYFLVNLELQDNKYLLDASEKTLAFGDLPMRALNNYARKLTTEETSEWVDLNPTEYSKINFRDSLMVMPDGSIKGSSQQILSGHFAYEFRKENDENSLQQAARETSRPLEKTELLNILAANLDERDEPLNIHYTLSSSADKIDDRIYLNPFSFELAEGNPFQLDFRQYPIDFGYKNAFTYSAIIEIPEGYSVEKLPGQKAIRLPGNAGSLLFVANQASEKILNVQCRVNLAKNVYEPEYYEGLKKFFNEILAVQQQSLIVLKENT